MMINNPKKRNIRFIDNQATYQYHKLEVCLNHLKSVNSPMRVAIDIGAHVGLWAMQMVKHFEHVYCFEPLKEHSDILPFNIDSDNYSIHHVALGNQISKVKMNVKTRNTGATHIGKIGEGNIDMILLDSLNLTDVDFIKIDVEGFEIGVILGAINTIMKNKPLMIVEQKGNDVKNFGGQRNEASKLLEKLGMRQIKNMANDLIMSF